MNPNSYKEIRRRVGRFFWKKYLNEIKFIRLDNWLQVF